MYLRKVQTTITLMNQNSRGRWPPIRIGMFYQEINVQMKEQRLVNEKFETSRHQRELNELHIASACPSQPHCPSARNGMKNASQNKPGLTITLCSPRKREEKRLLLPLAFTRRTGSSEPLGIQLAYHPQIEGRRKPGPYSLSSRKTNIYSAEP
ncbi:hypothetical protein OIU77_013471 [Salix suchowensis]|uniref:Uncharacterized protein n=1 Tax=Salix suchowensis TaxID=1278906 RepID=A0ABQ8ZUB4_9ROSI|nr:hypothetical protein OIU77_013471 [Salix suchowensis]